MKQNHFLLKAGAGFVLAIFLILISCIRDSSDQQEIDLVINQRYLNVPLYMDMDSTLQSLEIYVEDEVLGVFSAPLAGENPDFYGIIDLAHFMGKKLVVKSEGSASLLSGIQLDDKILSGQNLYQESLRPQFHFTSRRGWLNDPNGLIYYNGNYHMYFQHNPLGVHHGNMSWGHAVSADLIHWKEEAPVLYPHPETGACYSGAAFLDRENLLGKKSGDEDVIVAFYLRTQSGLSLAWSADGGYTFKDYEGNPVLNHPPDEEKLPDARMDTPRPFWFEKTQKWIAPTFDYFTREDGEMLRCVGFYSSENLVDWEFESRVEQDKWGDELCGCVDFFQLPLDKNEEEQKWIMIFLNGSYIVGSFDGHVFRTLEGKPASTADRVTDLIPFGNFVATMTWENMPGNRRVQISWMANWSNNYGMPFSQQMTLPSELSLNTSENGPRLRMQPVKELKKLRSETLDMGRFILDSNSNPLNSLNGDLYEIELEFFPGENSETVLDLQGARLIYNAASQKLSFMDKEISFQANSGPLKVQAFIDRCSIELYLNDGEKYIPVIHIPENDKQKYSLESPKGVTNVTSLKVHRLKSIL